MEPERQMTVRGVPPAIERWVQTLTNPVGGRWSRGTEIERKVKLHDDVPWPICLVWSGAGRHPKAALFLRSVSASEIAVTSVVPVDRKQLAPDDRQAALDAFQTDLVVPSGVEFVVEDRPAAARLADAISPQAVACFKTFVGPATNRTLLHVLDLSRWHNFLFQLHRDNVLPPREVVEKALGDEAFGGAAVRQLLEIYDGADDFLSRYDAFREGQ